jgi:hypothetical protein
MAAQPQPSHRASIPMHAQALFHDLSGEVKQELDEMRHGELPPQPSETQPHADLFVRRHVIGLILILFGLVALILLLGIAAVAVFGTGRHVNHWPGMLLPLLIRR